MTASDDRRAETPQAASTGGLNPMAARPVIEVVRLPHAEGLPLPS